MSHFLPLSPECEAVVAACIGCAIAVHRELGPGFREIIYERAFCLELDSRQLRFECEKPISVRYKEWTIPGQRIDLIVAESVLIEIKTVPRLRRIHRSQVISYLRTTGLRVGLLFNFNARLLRDGMQRIIL